MRIKQIMLLASVAAIALVCFGVRARTQAVENRGYQAIADRFFELLEQGKSDEAIDYFFSTNVNSKTMAPATVDQLKAKINALQKQLGSCHSHTKLLESKVAGMFVYQHYFVAYDLQPVSVRVKFYKPHATWMGFSVHLNADLDDFIEKQTDQNLNHQFK